jgi:hypothetical protein
MTTSTTTFANSAFAELDYLKTPEFPIENFGNWEFQDADDELRVIAEFIKEKTSHNSEIDPERIKFLYTTKAKKDAGRYIAGYLIARSNMDKMVNDEYDYFLVVFHPAWKSLDSKQKTIQLDKILCGIEIAPGKDPSEVLFKKKQTDSREYTENMRHFGAEEVLKSSEIVDMACVQAIEKAKEDAKRAKNGEVVDANIFDEDEQF